MLKKKNHYTVQLIITKLNAKKDKKIINKNIFQKIKIKNIKNAYELRLDRATFVPFYS